MKWYGTTREQPAATVAVTRRAPSQRNEKNTLAADQKNPKMKNRLTRGAESP